MWLSSDIWDNFKGVCSKIQTSAPSLLPAGRTLEEPQRVPRGVFTHQENTCQEEVNVQDRRKNGTKN